MTTQAIFVRQIDRLKQSFGERAYSKEKIELIWQEVKNLKDNDLTLLVDNLIADSRFAPTRKDFREGISNLRLERYYEEKKKISRESERMSDEIISGTFKFIGKIMQGQYSAEQVKAFADSVKSKQRACRFCDDSGYVFTKEKNGPYENIVFKCKCPIGKQNEDVFPSWNADFAEKYELMN